MIFFSHHFFLFCVVFFTAYWCIPQPRARRWLLIAACAVFHTYFAGPAGVLPIIVLGVGVYFAGRSRDKRACVAAITMCVAALIFYKYTYFFASSVLGSISATLGVQAVSTAKAILPAAPPLAISFFTFEFVHYLIEVYRGGRPIKDARSFTLFAIFWPTLVAGPIKRYRQFLPSLTIGLRNVGASDIYVGSLRVTGGILKKFVADNLTGWIDLTAGRFEVETLETRWLFLVLLGFRIYLDFSGYSDMAIGFARMMGIRISENFNWPHFALNAGDFWRRWHISLSSWIRDYVYIPLGGSRLGVGRRAMNALIAMALCGLWHGAAWNFLLWGLYHGCGLIAGTMMSRSAKTILCGQREMPMVQLTFVPIRWLATQLFVHFGWLLFFYPAERAWTMFALLFKPLT